MAWRDITERAESLLDRVKGAVRRRRGHGVPVRAAGAGARGSGELLDAAEHIAPPVDILEGAGELLIVADVPGASASRTEVTWDGEHGLVLHAYGPEIGEPSSGVHWTRAFTLPGGYDGAKAKATLEHGVLTVRVPREPALTPRPIPVRAG